MKKALITGITGQDGSYLAEFLLEKGYEVHGLIRRSSTFNTDRIDHLYLDLHDPKARLFLHYGDLSVSGQLMDLLSSIAPDEIYHLGAQSHVRVSFDMPEYTGDITGLGTLRILEAIRKTGITTNFTRPLPVRCSERLRLPSMNKLCFSRAVPMRRQKCMPITSCGITVTPTAFLPPTEFCSTMNPPVAAKHLSREKSPVRRPGSKWV
jgi:hypothetical protein